MREREKDIDGTGHGGGARGSRCGGGSEEEEPDAGSELDAVGLYGGTDRPGRRQVRHHAPRPHPCSRSPYPRPLVVLPLRHPRPRQGHRSQFGGYLSLSLLFYFFLRWGKEGACLILLILFSSNTWRLMDFLLILLWGFQHIKAIITAEEVSLSLDWVPST